MPPKTGKLLAVALAAGALALGMAAARSAEATATANDTARFLAGLPPAPDSALAELTRDPAWQQHARRFDAIFQHEEDTQLSKIRAFSKERLTEKHQTMLYMFSGPDFLYATSFFPSATTYVLSGLEPVGEVPPLTALRRGTLDGSLQNIESSLYSLVSYSFFITKNMKTQLRAGPVYGTLPILYVFLARTGKTIKAVNFVTLDADGNVQTVDESGDANAARTAVRRAAQSTTSGVKIVFSEGDHPSQTLYYFSTNLADDGVKRSGFLAFCDKLGPADSFIKSASYLLHGGGFARTRAFLLDHSATILQDDSGIPLAYFDAKKWRLHPFGHYVGPISIFPGSYQTGMAQLFRKATPIDFGLGYRWRKSESNLLLAEKTAPGAGEAELTPHSPVDRDRQGTDAQTPDSAKTTAESSRSHRKHVQEVAKTCRGWGIFSFCSRRR
jgi:hypothetical protein